MENNKNTNEKGPYKHFERPTTTRRANDNKLKKRSTANSADKKGHPQLWAGIIIIAIILIALIPIIESKLNSSSQNLAQKEVSTSKTTRTSHKKSKKKKSSNQAKKKLLANKNGYYTLQAGDTLTEIAKANDTTVAEIIRLNGLASENDIEVGQTLKIKEINVPEASSVSTEDSYSSKAEDTNSSVTEHSDTSSNSEQKATSSSEDTGTGSETETTSANNDTDSTDQVQNN